MRTIASEFDAQSCSVQKCACLRVCDYSACCVSTRAQVRTLKHVHMCACMCEQAPVREHHLQQALLSPAAAPAGIARELE